MCYVYTKNIILDRKKIDRFNIFFKKRLFQVFNKFEIGFSHLTDLILRLFFDVELIEDPDNNNEHPKPRNEEHMDIIDALRKMVTFENLLIQHETKYIINFTRNYFSTSMKYQT